MRQLAEVLVYLHDNGNQSKYIHVYMYFMDMLWYIEHCVHVCSWAFIWQAALFSERHTCVCVYTMSCVAFWKLLSNTCKWKEITSCTANTWTVTSTCTCSCSAHAMLQLTSSVTGWSERPEMLHASLYYVNNLHMYNHCVQQRVCTYCGACMLMHMYMYMYMYMCVFPALLMKPGNGRKSSCALGDFNF